MVQTKNLARALVLFERHFPWAWETHELLDRFWYYFAGRSLFRILEERNPSLPLRIPQPLISSGGLEANRPASLLAWLEAQTDDLAGQFDRRNGNDCFKRLLNSGRTTLPARVLTDDTLKRSKPRIMIIEENELLAEVLKEVLTIRGYRVELAKDAVTGLRRIRKEPFHLVMTNWGYPKRNGSIQPQGLRVLKGAWALQPGLPVIVMTGHLCLDSIKREAKPLAFDIFPKPFPADEKLFSIITAAVAP